MDEYPAGTYNRRASTSAMWASNSAVVMRSRVISAVRSRRRIASLRWVNVYACMVEPVRGADIQKIRPDGDGHTFYSTRHPDAQAVSQRAPHEAGRVFRLVFSRSGLLCDPVRLVRALARDCGHGAN